VKKYAIAAILLIMMPWNACMANPKPLLGVPENPFDFAMVIAFDGVVDFAVLLIAYALIKNLRLLRSARFFLYFMCVVIGGFAMDILGFSPVYLLEPLGGIVHSDNVLSVISGLAVILIIIGPFLSLYFYNRWLSKRFFTLEPKQASRIGKYMGILTHPLIGMVLLAPLFSGPDYVTPAKWSEGKAMMGTVATAIRTYAAENEAAHKRNLPTTFEELGFEKGDLKGLYFDENDIKFTVYSLDPVAFKITCSAHKKNAPREPSQITLNEKGEFIAGEKEKN
jgi:hypothetical protein